MPLDTATRAGLGLGPWQRGSPRIGYTPDSGISESRAHPAPGYRPGPGVVFRERREVTEEKGLST